VAPELITPTLCKVYVAFSVNLLAQVAALASLDVTNGLLVRSEGIAAKWDRVGAELPVMGCLVADSQANFARLSLGPRAAAFNDHCLEHKSAVRAFADVGARVTVSEPAENDVFLTTSHFQS
jgi:histidinol-phosphate aminotransferase